MNSRHSVRWLLVLLLWQASHRSLLQAHQDPRGDVDPQVLVVNGLFQVTFQSNLSRNSHDEGCLRVIYAPDGKVVVPRHRVSDPAVLQARAIQAMAREVIGADKPWIDAMEGGPYGEKSSHVVIREWIDHQRHEDPLPLKEARVDYVSGFHITKEHAAMLWWGQKGPLKGEKTQELQLTWFQRGSSAEPVTKNLGKTATIYFPVVSNLQFAQGRLWLAWVRETAQVDVFETMLAGYDPKTDHLEVKKLPGISHWNSHMSLATSNDWLCVAWHCQDPGDPERRSIIATAFEKMPPLVAKKP